MSFLSALILVVLVIAIQSFKWNIDEDLVFEEPIIVSEGYMFGSNRGPFLMSYGESYIDVDLRLWSSAHHNDTTRVLLIHVATDEEHGEPANIVPNLCDLESSPKLLEKLPFIYESTVRNLALFFASCERRDASDPPLACTRQRSYRERFPVSHTAWHSVLVVNCAGPDGRASHPSSSGSGVALPVVTAAASVQFRNPYGFIAAELSGLLPSQLLRLLLCLCATLYFAAVAQKHRAALQPLHAAVFALLALSLVEAATWTAAFFLTLNRQGRPYCCPFPASVGAALVLQVLRQALSRGVLLVVCLGLGIVRPRLLLLEWALLALLTLAYLAAALVAQTYSLTRFTSLAKAAEGAPFAVQAAAAATDLVFLLWICAAAQATMRVLAEYRQTAKLALYTSLWRLLSAAVVVFVLVSLVFFLDDVDAIDAGDFVHWRLTWLQPALWDLLNVLVLLAVAFLCLPSERARLLAYHSQLPQHDSDLDRDDLRSNSLFDEDGDDFDDFFLRHNAANHQQQQQYGQQDALGDRSSHGGPRYDQLPQSRDDDDDNDNDEGCDMEMVLLKQRGGFVSRQLLTKDAFSALSDDDNDNDDKESGRRRIGVATRQKTQQAPDDEFGLQHSD